MISKATILIAHNPIHRDRTKNVEVDTTISIVFCFCRGIRIEFFIVFSSYVCFQLLIIHSQGQGQEL